jgi:integrase/recombinase XerD
MVYSFARIGAVLNMKVEDYYLEGKRRWLRLLEKGGRHHEVPVHHKAEAVIDLYLEKAGISSDLKGYLIRSVQSRRDDTLTDYPLDTKNAGLIVKKRALHAALDPRQVCNHTFRASGITAYLEAGGTLEKAAEIAAHASIDTTRLYDRRSRKIAIGEIERIGI